jgi:hypothetical protein
MNVGRKQARVETVPETESYLAYEGSVQHLVNAKCLSSRVIIDKLIMTSNPAFHIDNVDDNLANGVRLSNKILTSQAPHLAKVQAELLDADTLYKNSKRTDLKAKVIIQLSQLLIYII